MKQVGDGGEGVRLGLGCTLQVGPRRWDQRARAVRQYQDEVQLSASVCPPQQLKRPPLERVATPNDGHPVGVAVEVVVGSVSGVPSTEYVTSG